MKPQIERERFSAVKGIKRMLLGIAIGTMNFLAWCGGGLGILIVIAGLFTNDKHE